MNKLNKLSLIAISLCVVISGCKSTGESHRADTYSTASVNQKIESKTIELIDIRSAKVAVDNSAEKESAQTAGMLVGGVLGALAGADNNRDLAIGAGVGASLGAAATSGVESTTMVDGVQLTYLEEVIIDQEDVVDGKRVTQAVKTKKTFTSAQIGKTCEFKPGIALMVTTVANETRIQPNGHCPSEG